MSEIELYYGDNLPLLQNFNAESFQLIYVDPPFNTGYKQSRSIIKTTADDSGDRVGYKGQKYKTTKVSSTSYNDKFDNYIEFIMPRLKEAYRILKPNGSLFVHLDYREVHYVKVELDKIFGRGNFINEIIWSYDYGARSKNKWSAKHDTILWYAKNAKDYIFNYSAIDRIPYLAPGLVGPEKAAIGKTPTTVWWNTIVSPTGKEKTGYATQKPLRILERIVKVHSNAGDNLLDFFSGSGSFGEAAVKHDRNIVMIDENKQAIDVMKNRFKQYQIKFYDTYLADTLIEL